MVQKEKERERKTGRARTGQRECAREQANKAQQNMCDKFFFLLFALALFLFLFLLPLLLLLLLLLLASHYYFAFYVAQE